VQGAKPSESSRNATLVLLPGLDGTSAFFQPLLQALPSWIRPVVVTYPSSGPNDYGDLLPLVERAVRDHDGVHILGWSFGGPLALMLASRRPSAVRSVILFASFVRAPHPGIAPFRQALRPSVVAAIRAIRRAPGFVRGYQTEGLRRAKADVWRSVDAGVLSMRARAALAVDVRPHLAACSAPLLYVAASRDRVIPRRNLDDVRSGACSCEVVTIDGTHLALVTNPEPAAAHIARFVARTA
jgi:pimeloyl-ACP methyl ester carboxylesterase